MKKFDNWPSTAMTFAVIFAFVIVTAAASVATAQDQGDETKISQSALEERLAVKLRTVQHLALNPVVVRAVRAQNSSGLSLEEIQNRDETWSGTEELTSFKRELQSNESGRFLKRTVENNPAFAEAFLTDNQGANVAAFPATSDYWQGDEEKWIESFNEGNGRIFVGPIEFDESSDTFQAQVSAPVINRGETMGVLIIGVNLSYIKAGN